MRPREEVAVSSVVGGGGPINDENLVTEKLHGSMVTIKYSRNCHISSKKECIDNYFHDERGV